MPLLATLESSAAQLHGLAAGLCEEAGIQLQIAEEWSWNPRQRILNIAQSSLIEQGAIYCAGYVSHEIGHVFLSRYILFRHNNELPYPLERQLLNALEDPRVDEWMGRRYPGAKIWLDRIHKDDLKLPLRENKPGIITFMMECAREPSRNWQSLKNPYLSDRVAQALEQTRQSRQQYHNELPPVHQASPVHDAGLIEFFRQQVIPDVVNPKGFASCHPAELRVLCSAWKAWIIARQTIFPVVKKLFTSDIQQVTNVMAQNPDMASQIAQTLDADNNMLASALLQKLLSHPLNTARQKPANEALQQLAEKALISLLNETSGTRAASAMAGAGSGFPSSHGFSKAKTAAAARSRANNSYQRLRAQVSPQIKQLVAKLQSLLPPRQHKKPKAGFPSGYRLDLPSLMAFDAKPQNYQKLWQRKPKPERHQSAISLLVDLSGSMRGKKIEAALAGTIILAETLSQLSIDFAINGFQDQLIPLCDFGSELSPVTQGKIASMLLEVEGDNLGGHNQYAYNDDGPCLLEAAKQLYETDARDRYLIVISDGVPSGRYSGEKELKQAIAELEKDPCIHLIGLGIGKETEHVNQFYPQAIANVPTDQFTKQLGKLLQGIIV